MGRKLILDTEWMLRARHCAWAYNYEKRQSAQAMGEQACARVLSALDSLGFPFPCMEISGWLDVEGSGLTMGEKVREVCHRAGLPLGSYQFLARWYWSSENWQVYVREFNSLPEIEGTYTFEFEGRLLPKVMPVDSHVDNSGASRYKSPVVPVPRELVERGMRQK